MFATGDFPSDLKANLAVLRKLGFEVSDNLGLAPKPISEEQLVYNLDEEERKAIFALLNQLDSST